MMPSLCSACVHIATSWSFDYLCYSDVAFKAACTAFKRGKLPVEDERRGTELGGLSGAPMMVLGARDERPLWEGGLESGSVEKK